MTTPTRLTTAELVESVLRRHTYDSGKSHHWRWDYLDRDIVGKWTCSCGATGTPEREWGGLTHAHRRHVAEQVARLIDGRRP